jgi:arabinan endo-1,5-alpha-L-arabinosidase
MTPVSEDIVHHRLVRNLRWASVAFGVSCLGCGGPSSAAPPPRADASSSIHSDAAAPVAEVGDGGSDDTTSDASTPDRPADGDVDAPGADAPIGLEGGNAGCAGATLGGGPETTSTMHLDVGVHDPSMIWDGHRYYLLATGGTLGVRSSADILGWTAAGNVFSAVPAWVTTALGSTPGGLWAPDVSFFNGQFHVYYAGSTFGSNDSVIGLATTPSMATPRWVDDGLVVQSKKTDDFNAIDPSVTFDASCTPWLVFGSFWSGIKLRKLDAATGKPATDDTALHSVASRNGGAIEAPSIVSHNGYYYLFVSFDACCKGVNSTYRTMVGRAKSITGPYTDKAGANMMDGAAEQLLASSGRYIGPGGGTAWKNGDTYLYVYHYYDGDANGDSKLAIRPVGFDSADWITLGDPLFQ